MAAARLIALLVPLLAAALPAQNPSTSQVEITVVDRSGWHIPDAHIRFIQLQGVIPDGGDWRHYVNQTSAQASAQTDADGKATVALAKQSYEIIICARGFSCDFERMDVGGEPSLSFRATLALAATCPPCETPVDFEASPEISVEPTSLNLFMPLEPLQTVKLKAARLRRRQERPRSMAAR